MDSIAQAVEAVANCDLQKKRAARLDLLLESRGLPTIAELLRELYDERCLTIQEISALLRVNRNTVFSWIGKFAIQRAPAKRRLVSYSLGDDVAVSRYYLGAERCEERFVVPDEGLLWLLGFGLGDGNVGFYPEKKTKTAAPEFAVFNKEPALIDKSIRIMERWNLNPLKVAYASSGTFPTKLPRVPVESAAANFWKVKALSALLPASLLVSRANRRRHDTFIEISRHRHWIAPFVSGFFDAEGRAPRGTGRKSEVPNLSVYNTDYELIDSFWKMLNDGFGLHTSRLYTNNYSQGGRKKHCYCFDITGQWAVRFIKEVGYSHPIKLQRGNKLLDWKRA
jgi:hypothetical protein